MRAGGRIPAQWENHGDYVSCVAHAARELREHGVISHDQKGEVVSRAAKSSCGRSPAAACPNGLQPNQCGTWDGVELVAEREYPAADDDDHRHHRDHHRDRHGAKHDSGEDTRGLAVDAERCLCRAIAFELPAELIVASGDSGHARAKLTFSRSDRAELVTCAYRGNASGQDDEDEDDGCRRDDEHDDEECPSGNSA